jgi:hypothetical protein
MSLTKLFLEFQNFLEPSVSKTLLRQKYSWTERVNFPKAETFPAREEFSEIQASLLVTGITQQHF